MRLVWTMFRRTMWSGISYRPVTVLTVWDDHLGHVDHVDQAIARLVDHVHAHDHVIHVAFDPIFSHVTIAASPYAVAGVQKTSNRTHPIHLLLART